MAVVGSVLLIASVWLPAVGYGEPYHDWGVGSFWRMSMPRRALSSGSTCGEIGDQYFARLGGAVLIGRGWGELALLGAAAASLVFVVGRQGCWWVFPTLLLLLLLFDLSDFYTRVRTMAAEYWPGNEVGLGSMPFGRPRLDAQAWVAASIGCLLLIFAGRVRGPTPRAKVDTDVFE